MAQSRRFTHELRTDKDRLSIYEPRYSFRLNRSNRAMPPPSTNAPKRNHIATGMLTKPINKNPMATMIPIKPDSMRMTRHGPGCRSASRVFIASLSHSSTPTEPSSQLCNAITPAPPLGLCSAFALWSRMHP